jgi:DNA-binding GntR family transcriptional regulator
MMLALEVAGVKRVFRLTRQCGRRYNQDMPRSPGRRPLYQQIADDLRKQVIDGLLEPGSQLPTEAEIAERYNTTRPTVRQGIGVLVNEGLVVADRPRGHFVRSWDRMAYRPLDEVLQPRAEAGEPQPIDQFIREQARVGRVAKQVIEVAIVEPPLEVASRLRLEPDDAAVVRRRVRYIDNQPFNTNDSYYPRSIVEGSEISGPGDIARGANLVLAELGYPQVRTKHEILVRMPRPDEVARLELGPGTPVAIHLCTGYTASGLPVRVVFNCLPGDRHVIQFERDGEEAKGAQ